MPLLCVCVQNGSIVKKIIMTSIILLFFLVTPATSITNVIVNECPGDDCSVQGLKKGPYIVHFSKIDCNVSTSQEYRDGTRRFEAKNLKVTKDSCNLVNNNHFEVNVDNDTTSSYEAKDFHSRKCNLTIDGTEQHCMVTIDFKYDENFIDKKIADTTNSSAVISNGDQTDPNLYIYVGAPAAVVTLIVLQVWYNAYHKKKIELKIHTLENELQRREERQEANDRYSAEPIIKKCTKTTASENEDVDGNLYESLEYIRNRINAKDSGESIRSVDIKNRPPLPLPHEKPNPGREDDWTKTMKERPPMPLPSEISLTGHSATKTLPHRNCSQKASSERFPDPSLSSSMNSLRRKPNVPMSPLHRNDSHHGSNDRIREPPPPANLTPSRLVPNVMTKSLKSTTGKPPIPPLHKNNLQHGSNERILEPPPPANITPSRLGPNVTIENVKASPVLGKPPVNTQLNMNISQQAERFPDPPAPKKPQPGNVMDELNKILHKKHNNLPANSNVNNSHPSVRPMNSNTSIIRQKPNNAFNHVPPPPINLIPNEHRDSSDEEWTYEKLPPMKKYLH